MRAASPSPLLLIAASIALSGCLEDNTPPQGLRQARLSGGPQIVFDLNKRPFPEIPFPNDLAMRADPTSSTGLRVNVSELGGTLAEERVRRAINKQEGFGLLAPLTVSFDAPLDVHDIVERHQEPVPDFSDDAIYVVNVDPDSPGYGELVLLDMGRGNYPLTMTAPQRYFDNDPRRDGTNLLFETVAEEDLNGNGLLEPIEDTDDDGVFDRPNTLDEGVDPLAFGQLLEFYERETDTLVMRPVEPLRPGTTYAVVLTAALTGETGLPIDSPFEAVNHMRQTEALEPLRTILPEALPERFDRTLSSVRFAWSFTTRVPTRELEAIRAGLYGHGPLARLADEFPPEFELLHQVVEPDAENPMIFRVDEIIPLITPLVSQVAGGSSGEAIAQTFEDVDYVVSGSFRSPHFLVDRDGLSPGIPSADEIEEGDHLAIDRLNMQEDDEAFEIDLATGEAAYREDEVTFTCVIPKETPAQQAPFPTIIYSHAIGSTRLEGLVFAGAMTKFGMATCTIDAIGHGVAIPEEFTRFLDMVTSRLDLPGLPALVNHHRARDMDGDGVVDSGGDYFTTDLLHSRDNIRQTTVDQLQLVRILRSFDGVKRFPAALDEQSPYVKARRDVITGFDADGDGEPELAGDFNGDGVVDLGGDRPMVAWGTSLGGIQTTVLAGIEPTIRAVVSNAGGGGLLDIAVRTEIANVRVGALLRTLGPIVVGRPKPGDEGVTELSWILPEVTNDRRVPFAWVEGIEDGDVVVLRNLVREQSPYVEEHDLVSQASVRRGRFRVGLAADALPTTARRAILGADTGLYAYESILGCVEASECALETCEDGHYCSPDGECRPLDRCVVDFDASAPLEAAEREAHVVRDPRAFGDAMVIEIYDEGGELKRTIDTFELNVLYDNLLYPAGSDLAALVEGWGLKRQTPRMRQFFGIGQLLLEPADPAIWASHYVREPLEFPYERPPFDRGETNALIVGTLGDQTVPINTALTLARAAGALDYTHEDARYGATANQFLVHNQVYEGIEWLDRHPERPGMLFDPDDLDRGRFRSARDDRTSPEALDPLRATERTPWGGVSALRLPYLDERGAHTFNAPNPSLPFDIHTFMLNQTGWYLANGGREISDDPCLERDVMMETCDFFDRETFTPEFEPRFEE